MSNQAILVTFSDINQASADCNAVAGTIENDLNDLRTYLGPITASWTGAASVQYQSLQARWNSAANDLNTVLHNIGQALNIAHQNYTAAEQTNAIIWGS